MNRRFKLFFNVHRSERPESANRQRSLVDQVPQAVQVLPRVVSEAREELLQLQGETRERLQRAEAQPREEHIRAEHSDGAAESGPAWPKGGDHRAGEEMEAQQVQPRRGVQGVRHLPGGSHVGAQHADRWRYRDLRHGRAESSADVAI